LPRQEELGLLFSASLTARNQSAGGASETPEFACDRPTKWAGCGFGGHVDPSAGQAVTVGQLCDISAGPKGELDASALEDVGSQSLSLGQQPAARLSALPIETCSAPLGGAEYGARNDLIAFSDLVLYRDVDIGEARGEHTRASFQALMSLPAAG
jgi:hypothetical protein